MSTIHIESKKEDIADVVLMPGDPMRVKYIAEKYLTEAKLVNQVRGELAYTGYYKNKKVTVFSSGMGIPSMGIYSYELFKYYDVNTILRIGTARSVSKDINIGDVVLVSSSMSKSSYGLEMFNKKIDSVSSSIEVNSLFDSLKKVKAYSVEAFYERNITFSDVEVVEMESYSLFLNAKHLNKKAGCLLTITDKDNESVDYNYREKKLDEMILLALDNIIKL